MAQGALGSQKVRTMLCALWLGDSGSSTQLDNSWVSMLRIQVLSRTLSLEELQGMGFVERFANWALKFSPDLGPSGGSDSLGEGDRLRREWMYWTYHLTLAHLLEHEGNVLSQELVSRGHLAMLHSMLQDFPGSDLFRGAPLGLHAFLFLWHQGILDLSDTRVSDIYMTREWLQTIDLTLNRSDLDITLMISCMKTYGGVYFVDIGTLRHREWAQKKMGLMLDWLLSYLQQATREGLLDEARAESAMGGYGRWRAALVDYSEGPRAKFKLAASRVIGMNRRRRLSSAPGVPGAHAIPRRKVISQHDGKHAV